MWCCRCENGSMCVLLCVVHLIMNNNRWWLKNDLNLRNSNLANRNRKRTKKKKKVTCVFHKGTVFTTLFHGYNFDMYAQGK